MDTTETPGRPWTSLGDAVTAVSRSKNDGKLGTRAGKVHRYDCEKTKAAISKWDNNKASNGSGKWNKLLYMRLK